MNSMLALRDAAVAQKAGRGRTRGKKSSMSRKGKEEGRDNGAKEATMRVAI